MSRESKKRITRGVRVAAAIRYGLLSPSTEMGNAIWVVRMAGSGLSAEALFAPKIEVMKAQRKQSIPKHGHLRRASSPT